MNYYNKYIKYKRKYFILKNMIGSGRNDIPEYYRCNNCDENKIFPITYKGKSKKICLKCKNELQQVKYLECPNSSNCSIADNGPFLSTFLGENPKCFNCGTSLKELSKKKYDDTQKLAQKTTTPAASSAAASSAAAPSTPVISYKTDTLDLLIRSRFNLIKKNIDNFIKRGLIDHNIIINQLNVGGKPLIILSLNIAQKQIIDINKYPGNVSHQAYTKIRSKKELTKVKNLNSRLQKVGEFGKILRYYQSNYPTQVNIYTNRTSGERIPNIILEKETNIQYSTRLNLILQLLIGTLDDLNIPTLICLQEINPLNEFKKVFSTISSSRFNLHHHDDTKGTHSVLIYSTDLSVNPIDNNWLRILGQQRPQKIMGYSVNGPMLEIHNIHTTYFENNGKSNNADIFLQKILESFTGSNKIIVGDANLKLSYREIKKWENIFKIQKIHLEFVVTPEIAYLSDDIDANPTYDIFASYLI